MVTSSTRWWWHRRSLGLMIFPVVLLALARGSVADIGMDAKVAVVQRRVGSQAV